MKSALLYPVCCLLMFSACARVVRIDTGDAMSSLALSRIAEEVIPIPLNISGEILHVHLTDEFLYTGGHYKICKYDLSGNLLNAVDCGDEGYIHDITGDAVKKEIYVSKTGKEIRSYDYSLKETNVYKTQYEANSIFFHKNKLWVQSCDLQKSKGYVSHRISELDLVTGKETFLPFEYKNYAVLGRNNSKAYYSESATFSIYKGRPVFIFCDSIIYKIADKKVTPLVRLNIKSTKGLLYRKKYMALTYKGFVGRYLYVNYAVNDSSLKDALAHHQLYLKDTKNGEVYHLHYRDFFDDIYQTGYCRIGRPFNKEGYFYFIKYKTDIDGKTDRIKTKEGSVIMIVKTKQ